MRLSIQNQKIMKRSEHLNVPRGTLRQIKSLDKNRGLIFYVRVGSIKYLN